MSNKKISKKFIGGILILITISLVLFFLINNNGNNNQNSNNKNSINGLGEFNKCLSANGMVVYGSNWCPACRQVVEILGGYEKASRVYVDCDIEQQRCANEAKTGYVPEIQINGEIYQGSRTLNGFSEATGCPLPS